MKKIVLLSGGIDSTTCLAIALDNADPEDVLAVNVYYGQLHKKEMEAARNVARHYGVQIIEINLADIFQLSDCPLLEWSSKQVPTGTYFEQQKSSGRNPVATYVPFRNGLMLSAAASIAVSIGATEIYYGAHADDAAGNAYPDCSVEFTERINEAIKEGTANKTCVVAPLIRLNKTQVVAEGLKRNAPYNLTWSCYNGGEKPCGKCGTCLDRERAFRENGVKDPAI